jgi:glycerol kinase
VTTRTGEDWLLGVDIGTGSVKALAVTPAGQMLAAACLERPMRHERPGWAENDPDDWLRGVVGAVRHETHTQRTGAACRSSQPRAPHLLQVNGLIIRLLLNCTASDRKNML